MRIKIEFSKNIQPVPTKNQSMLNSYIHKCLGINNKYHDAPSNYNISHLYGGKLSGDEISFDDGAYIIVSSFDQEFLNKFLIGVLNNQELFCGMRFSGVTHINEKFYNGWNHFYTLSPFIIEKKEGEGENKFLTLNEEDFQDSLEKYLIKKLSKINPNLDLTDFKVVVPNHKSHKVKKIFVNTRRNWGNQCQISVFCNRDVAETLYTYGIGKSTGSGFGCVYKTENHRLYRKNIVGDELGLKKSLETVA